MTALQIELSVASANAKFEVFQAHSKVSLSAETAGLMAREANAIAREILDVWLRVRTDVMAGMPARHARDLTEPFLKVLQTTDRIFTDLGGFWLATANDERGRPTKTSVDSLNATLSEVRRFAQEAEGILELLSRPPAPMTRSSAMHAASRASFQRGEGKTYEDWQRERGNREPA